LILENESILTKKETQLSKKLAFLKSTDPNDRSEQQKKDIAEKEAKLTEMRRNIHAVFKLIGDLVREGYAPTSAAIDVLKFLAKDLRDSTINY
jgi:uncharacterized protein involved in exopolysaccharide biosynthesis